MTEFTAGPRFKPTRDTFEVSVRTSWPSYQPTDLIKFSIGVINIFQQRRCQLKRNPYYDEGAPAYSSGAILVVEFKCQCKSLADDDEQMRPIQKLLPRFQHGRSLLLDRSEGLPLLLPAFVCLCVCLCVCVCVCLSSTLLAPKSFSRI